MAKAATCSGASVAEIGALARLADTKNRQAIEKRGRKADSVAAIILRYLREVNFHDA
jgi:hypothetical protein